jgi:cation transport ATPase
MGPERTKNTEDERFQTRLTIASVVAVGLLLLIKGPDVAELVGGVLGLVGAVPASALPSANASRVASFVWLALVVGLLFAVTRIVAWVEQGRKYSWTNRQDGRAWAALLMALGLCAALGVGATIVFQLAAGLPVHLTPQAALAGLPFALLILLGVVFILAS